MNAIDIIGTGLGKQDLTQKHLDLIRACDVLVGGDRHLKWFDDLGKQKIPIKGPIAKVVEAIREKIGRNRIVVLASGDPLFYGIGSTLIHYFDKVQLNIHSNISSVSAAFAAIKEPWHDAAVISLHGQKEIETLSFSKLSTENKIAFLTSPEMNPGVIAEVFIKAGIYDFSVCVLENLGAGDQERISWFDNMDLVRQQTFQEPNIVILLKRSLQKSPAVSRETYIGMEDSLFKHSKGLITKSEIRCVTLSKLKFIKKDHVLWDIGSGSGSVGIEASFLIPWGLVYAVEKHPGRISDLVHNIKNFNCSNVKVVNSEFPDGIEDLKTPDRIFIGGGGKNMAKILESCCEKMMPSGRIVVNTVLLQTIATTLACFEKHGFLTEVVQIQVSRSKAMPYGDRLEAINPVWIISGAKQG
ncbi:MAG: precorrin-6y C5,15-methyltransferase (decarboxylating) subunit CbiE [Desulfobacula sp.]|nr:precorrin-6y C5,15-methyltransferase (decarboxylating) subunit CbiE [Desulfobacula sp.]MDA8135024.1 precorrin-6y C5,15-methyltransferase (decarboxylating) subunit CbiE [Desulfobacteraceae bacterium]